MIFVEFEPGTKYAKSGADTSNDHEAFSDCGIKLNSSDIVIDIDTLPKETIQEIIRRFDIHTQTVWTDRGAHLYFEKPAERLRRRDGVCRLGFEIEQMTSDSRPNGVTVKRGGVLRQIDNADRREVLPDIFRVGTPKTPYYKMLDMAEGDGRNKRLFAHKVRLEKEGVRNSNQIIDFINEFIFADPLPENEMDTLHRDIEFLDNNAEEESIIAKEMIDELMITKWSRKIWFRQGNRFVGNEDELVREIWRRIGGKKMRFMQEVLGQIKTRCESTPALKSFPVRLRNGYLQEGQFIPTAAITEFTPYYIDTYYRADAAPVQVVDDYIKNLTGGEEEYKCLLLEALGYCLVTNPEKIRSIGKFFFLRGDGANGKGTLLQIIKTILGAENCSTMSIKQMQDERYFVSMVGKLANLGDDVEPEAINNKEMKMLKNVATADTVEGRFLYEQSGQLNVIAKMFFTTNSDLKSWEKGFAYKRRVLWLPMFIKIEKPDPNFITKLTTPEALEYWVKLIVDGYFRLYGKGCDKRKKDGFTFSPAVAMQNDKYHKENNPMIEFIEYLQPEGILGKTPTEIKRAFADWNPDEIEFRPKQFRQAVWEIYEIGCGMKKGIGRVYMRAADTDQNIAP